VARTNIELARLIETVADQLRAARSAGPGGDPIIDLAECELELAVEVTNEGGAGIKVWVFELGGRRSKSNTNTVRVRFTPHGAQPIAFAAQVIGSGPPLGQQPGPGPELGPGPEPGQQPEPGPAVPADQARHEEPPCQPNRTPRPP